MPVVITGTPIAVPLGASATPAAQNVTVPADAQYAVFMFNAWRNAAANYLSSLSSTFGGSWTTDQKPSATDGSASVSVSWAPVTSTGAKTFTPVFSGVAGEGGVGFLFFVKGAHASTPVREMRTKRAINNDALSDTIASTTSDLVVVMDQRYDSNILPLTESGYTSVQTCQNNAESAVLRTANSPGASTTTANAQGITGAPTQPHYSSLAMIAFEVAAAGSPGPTISAQPSNATVTAPNTANFSVTAAASGGGSLTYQWERSNNGGSSWANVSSGTGGTTNSYTTASTSSTAAGSGGDNGAIFRCVVTETGGTNPGSLTSSSATLTVNAVTLPTITNADDESFFPTETGIVITGTNFGSKTGPAKVVISPTNNAFDAGAVTQTDTAWTGTSITFTCVKGALNFDTNLYLFVIDSSGNANATGYVVQINPRVYIRHTFKSKAGAAWANETGLTAIIYTAVPTPGSPNPQQVLGSLTLDASGVSNWLINRGSLALNANAWLIVMKAGSPNKAYAGNVALVYE